MSTPFRNALLLIVLLAAGALGMALVPARQTVSLELLEYRRWPHGAMLRLTNGTQTSIWYHAEPGDGKPLLLMPLPDGQVRRDGGVISLPELKPGQAVDFFVRLKPDTPPIKVGVAYLATPPGEPLHYSKWEIWLACRTSFFGFQIPHKGRGQVWSKSLSVAESL